LALGKCPRGNVYWITLATGSRDGNGFAQDEQDVVGQPLVQIEEAPG